MRSAKKVFLFSSAVIFFFTVFTVSGVSGAMEINVVLPMRPESDFLREQVTHFEEETGISVRMAFYGENQYRDQALVELIGGSGSFDIFAVDSVYIPMLAEAGMIEPLEAITNEGFDIEEFNPFVLESLSHNGTLFALPHTREVSILMYRKDIFEENNLLPPQTFDELEAHAAQLIHVPDLFPLALRASAGEGNNIYSWAHLFRSYGGVFFDADVNPVFYSEEGIKATEMYARLLSAYAPPPLTELDKWQVANMFSVGAVAMTIDSHSLYKRLELSGLSQVAGDVGYAPVPEGLAGRHPGNRIFGLVVDARPPKRAGFMEAIAAFLAWATSREMEELKRDKAGITSLCRDELLLESDFVEKVPSDWLEATFEAFEQVYHDFRPRIPEWYFIAERLSNSLEGVITGAITPREALAREHEAALEYGERNGMIDDVFREDFQEE